LRVNNRAPNQMGSQIADNGFNFGKFGHYKTKD